MIEKDILELIEQDSWMMGILKTVRTLNLPDWWIGAGFVRSKAWDSLHNNNERTPLPDIDVIYFNPQDPPTISEKKIWQTLKHKRPELIWSVTNVAHRHKKTGHPGYKNASEGLSYWIETATCVGVKLDNNNQLELTAPRGIDDLVNLVLRPVSNTPEGKKIFLERIKKNNG